MYYHHIFIYMNWLYPTRPCSNRKCFWFYPQGYLKKNQPFTIETIVISGISLEEQDVTQASRQPGYPPSFFWRINFRKFHENISASHMPQHEQQIMTRREIFYEFSMNRSHWRVHLLQWIVIANKNIWSHRDFWWWKLTLVTTFIIWCTQVLNHMIYIMWYHLIM